MRKGIVPTVLTLGFLAISTVDSVAAPPASCASKFVGVWTYAGGVTTVNRDGTANPKCLMCVAVQTWTCSGNTYIITGPTSYSATLSADGRQMIGSAGVAIRVGGAAPAAAPAAKKERKPEPENKQAPGSRKALQKSAAASPKSTTGASAPPGPAVGRVGKMWDGRAETCEQANKTERNTASWYNMCVPAALTTRKTYRPSITPETLYHRARDQCLSSPLGAKRQCINDAKMKILLQVDPGIRSRCEHKVGIALIACVDTAYSFGSELNEERARLFLVIQQMPGASWEEEPELKPREAPPRMPTGCAEGFGMKPTPGAFGAWSCQKLGTFAMNSERPELLAATRESDATFERHSNRLVQRAVASAFVSLGQQLTADMRRQCRDPVFIAARGLLTGEVSTIPQRCEALASAARDEVTRYAGTHIDSLSPQVEEILAYLALGNPVSGGLNSGALGAPLPGMTGLAPDARQMREDECMLRGGAQENCRAVLAQGSPSSNADCTRAETHWKSAEDIKTLAAYEDHLARFASCEFANLAKTRIERLKK